MKARSNKVPEIKYAFTISNSYEKIMDICKYGLEYEMKEEISLLGPSDSGSYLCLHPDTIFKHIDDESIFLVMYQVN